MYSEILEQLIECNDKCFERYIKDNVIWDEDVVMAIIDNLQPNTEFLDIGANIGLTSLYVNKLSHIDDIEIICFEPVTETYEMLFRNTRRYSNIKCFNVGISDMNRNYSMMRRKNYTSMDEVYNKDNEYDENYQEIGKYEFVKLDYSFIFRKVSVIKIDVEGHEYEVLQGCEGTIHAHRPVIIIEIFMSNYRKVFQLLQSYGYYKDETLNNDNYIFKPFTSNLNRFYTYKNPQQQS